MRFNAISSNAFAWMELENWIESKWIGKFKCKWLLPVDMCAPMKGNAVTFFMCRFIWYTLSLYERSKNGHDEWQQPQIKINNKSSSPRFINSIQCVINWWQALNIFRSLDINEPQCIELFNPYYGFRSKFSFSVVTLGIRLINTSAIQLTERPKKTLIYSMDRST